MQTVNKNTRAGKAGRGIFCPQCHEEVRLYHFEWAGLTCTHCGADVDKQDWLVSLPDEHTATAILSDNRLPCNDACQTGREPIINPDRPSWHYEEPATGRLMTYSMGYINNDPCMALFAGESNEPILIPASVLCHVLDLGAQKDADLETFRKRIGVYTDPDPESKE
jgi:hypothetical protein